MPSVAEQPPSRAALKSEIAEVGDPRHGWQGSDRIVDTPHLGVRTVLDARPPSHSDA